MPVLLFTMIQDKHDASLPAVVSKNFALGSLFTVGLILRNSSVKSFVDDTLTSITGEEFGVNEDTVFAVAESGREFFSASPVTENIKC